MSGYIGTKTPLKLKRDTPNTLSTIDRTALPSHSTLRNVPPLRELSKEAPQIQHVQIALKRSTPADTAKMEREIADIISKDERLSQRSRTHTKSGHSFSMRPLQSRIVLSKAHPIPSRVRQLYEQSANNEGRCDFAQGTLTNSCLQYFAVGKKVLFYDIGRAIQTGSDLEEQFMHECQFDETVLQVKELAMRHMVFGEFKNRSILLVISPWKFSFASLDLQGGERVESGPRWMRVTLLKNSYTTASQSVSHIVEDESEKRLYYLDQEGGVNSVSFENSKWIDKLMGACKYHLAQKTIPASIGMQAFYVSRRASLLERIKHYSKVVAAQVSSFYCRKIKNYELVADSKRKTIYSLVDTNYDPRECSPSTFKMLTAWDTTSNKLKIKCQISEAELYQREIAGIANFPVSSNYRIARLFPVSASLEEEANLIAVLQCGIRLYISAEDSFRVVAHHFPPQIDRPHSLCDPRQHHKPVQLTHCSIKGSEVLLNLREEGENHTFFLWRMDESVEAQKCAQVNWGSNMSTPHGNPPQQDKLSTLKLSLTSTKKQAIIKELSIPPLTTKNPFSGASSLHELHQLARDLLLPPFPMVHSTDADIQWICQLRPVDQIFNAVHANLKEQQVISRIFEDLPPEQIIFLLVQVLCDPEGLYLKDLALIDCLAQFERRVMQQGGMQFHKFQEQHQEKTTKVKGRKPKEIQAIYVSRGTIGKEMEERLLQMMVKLAHRNQQGRVRTQLQVQQLLCNGIVLYLARLLRFLWRRTVKEINNKLQALVPMIEPLHRVLEHFKSPASKPKVIPVRQYKLESYLAARKLHQQSNESLSVQAQPLLQMQKLISKISQLITLCSKVDLKTKKTFSQALAMSSEQFQGPLFHFLTDKYEYPTVAIDLFRKNFPCFIGDNLQKSLRIWQQSKGKAEAEIVAILRYHKTVPNYLMRYFEANGKIGPDSARLLQALSTIPSSNKSSEEAAKNQSKLNNLEALYSDFFKKK